MKKKLSYRDQLLELAKIYCVKEIRLIKLCKVSIFIEVYIMVICRGNSE